MMFENSSLQSYSLEEQQFSAWLTTPLGRAYMTQEQTWLAQLMPRAFGHYSVYLGLNAQLSVTLESPIKHAMALTANPSLGGHMLMDPHQLPIATESIDLVVMQHVLDMSNNPHQVLREAARIVQTGGRLVITGFNPYGPWGLWRWLRLRRGAPWRAQFLAHSRLKDWLALLNFGDFDIKSVYDCSPSKMRIQTWLPWLIQPLSAGYVLCAVKQETRVHLLKTHWARRSVKAKFGLAGATQQNGHTHQKTTGDK
jgi:SAM-dependent methyltransferase